MQFYVSNLFHLLFPILLTDDLHRVELSIGAFGRGIFTFLKHSLLLLFLLIRTNWARGGWIQERDVHLLHQRFGRKWKFVHFHLQYRRCPLSPTILLPAFSRSALIRSWRKNTYQTFYNEVKRDAVHQQPDRVCFSSWLQGFYWVWAPMSPQPVPFPARVKISVNPRDLLSQIRFPTVRNTLSGRERNRELTNYLQNKQTSSSSENCLFLQFCMF